MIRLADNPVLRRLAAELQLTKLDAEPRPTTLDPGLRAFIERRCPLNGKTRYATKAAARRFAASTPTLTVAYRCGVCAGYHVASRRRGR